MKKKKKRLIVIKIFLAFLICCRPNLYMIRLTLSLDQSQCKIMGSSKDENGNFCMGCMFQKWSFDFLRFSFFLTKAGPYMPLPMVLIAFLLFFISFNGFPFNIGICFCSGTLLQNAVQSHYAGTVENLATWPVIVQMRASVTPVVRQGIVLESARLLRYHLGI